MTFPVSSRHGITKLETLAAEMDALDRSDGMRGIPDSRQLMTF
jgi:hypothetical protein